MAIVESSQTKTRTKSETLQVKIWEIWQAVIERYFIVLRKSNNFLHKEKTMKHYHQKSNEQKNWF